MGVRYSRGAGPSVLQPGLDPDVDGGLSIPAQGTAVGNPGLLEREAERTAFIEASRAATRGAGRLIIVEAAAGTGKSELLNEAGQLCREAGLVVARARGAELEREHPFGVVRQLFERLLASGETERDRLLDGAAGKCAALFGSAAGRSPSPESQGMFKLLDGLYWLTVNLAQDRGIALIIDDADWSDPQSLAFLGYLSRRIDNLGGILILGTRPDGTETHGDDLGHLLSDPSAVVLRPRPLSHRAVAQLIRAALGEDADQPFCLACHEVTGGNPLLVRELLHALAVHGVAPNAGALVAVRLAGPAAVARYAKARGGLRRAEDRKLAEAVAILGDGKELRLAADLAGMEVAAAAEVADRLVNHGIFACAIRPAFIHQVVQAAVYQAIPPAQRSRANDRATAVLAASDPGAADDGSRRDVGTTPSPPVLSARPVAGASGSAPAAASAPARGSRRTAVTVGVLALVVLMSMLDLFIVNLAFPYMGDEWPNVSMGGLSWVLNAYTIVFAAVMVPAGRWADRFGRRGTLVAGLLAFCAGSVLSGLAPRMDVLIAGRIVQGAGAGLMVPASLSLLLASVPAAARTRAIGTWAGMGAVGAALGPLIGGSLVQVNWRWVFWINLPVGLATIVLALRTIPESKNEKERRWPDLIGAVLLAAAVGLVAYGLVEAPGWGWRSHHLLSLLAIALACLAALVLRSRWHPSPVIELGLLRSVSFSGAFAASVLYYAGFGALVLNSVEFLISVWHYSPVQAGAAIVPGPLLVLPVARFLAPRLAVWLRGVGRVAAVGCAVNAGAQFLWFIGIQAHPAYLTHLLPAQLLGGVGVGLAVPSLLAAGSASLPPAWFGTGSGILNMARQVGTVLGVAGLVAIIARDSPAHPVVPYREGLVLIIAFLAAAGLVAATMLASVPAKRTAPARVSSQGLQQGRRSVTHLRLRRANK